MYVFGGKNEEQEFNDLKVMKLINPSERQPGISSVHTCSTVLVLWSQTLNIKSFINELTCKHTVCPL